MESTGRKPSVIWNYYTDVDRKEKVANCIFCQKALSYKSTCTNLKQHLRARHRIQNLFAVEVNLRDLPKKQQQGDSSLTVKSENGDKSDEDTDSFIYLDDIDEEISISNSDDRASLPSRKAVKRNRPSTALQPASMHQLSNMTPPSNAAPLPNVPPQSNVAPSPCVVSNPCVNLPQKKSLKELNNYDSSENEFDLFCRSLGIQLKNMPLERALICQEKLQSVMLQERLSQLRGCSVKSYRTRTHNACSQSQNTNSSQLQNAGSTQSQNVHSTQSEKAYTHIIVPISSLSVPAQNSDTANTLSQICENSVQSSSN